MSVPKRKRMKLEEAYNLYGDPLYRYLTAVLGSTQDAEDVLQETFCRFARYSARWKLVRDPRAFAFRCARNEAHRFLEKRILERNGAKAFRPELVSTILRGPDSAAEVRLGEALAGLPEEQREAVLLKEFEGLTFKAIGSVCGVSTNTAASRYRYGMDQLRHFFGGKP
jgi:RNA polymerase sigma-70 factor (ECF subfamily)